MQNALTFMNEIYVAFLEKCFHTLCKNFFLKNADHRTHLLFVYQTCFFKKQKIFVSRIGDMKKKITKYFFEKWFSKVGCNR